MYVFQNIIETLKLGLGRCGIGGGWQRELVKRKVTKLVGKQLQTMIISIYLSLSHAQKLLFTSCQEHYYWICITAGMGGCLENKAYDHSPRNCFLSFSEFKTENWQQEPLLQVAYETASHERVFISDEL